MRWIFVLIAGISSSNLIARSTISATPELQLWYELMNTSYGASMSYLPDFDTTATRSAIALISIPDGQTSTWYNKYKGDSTNHFVWGAGAAGKVFQVDLNSDGVVDYIDGAGRLYLGSSNGAPPSFARKTLPGNYTVDPYSCNVNNDSYSDLVFPSVRTLHLRSKMSALGVMVLGMEPLDSIHTINLPLLGDEYQQLVGAFTGADAIPRVLVLVYNSVDYTGSLVLYKVRLTKKASSTYDVQYEYLTQYSNGFANADQLRGATVLLCASDTKERTFVWNDTLFSVEDSGIRSIRVSKSCGGVGRIIRNNCVADSISYINVFTEDSSLNVPQYWVGVIEGNPRIEQIPKAKMPFIWSVPSGGTVHVSSNNSFCPAGDLNGDGAMDYVIYYTGTDSVLGNISCLRYYLGFVESTRVAVINESANEMDVYPTVLSSSGLLHIMNRIENTKSSSGQLYDINGRKVGALAADLAFDKSDNVIDLSQYNLAAGCYNVALKNGEKYFVKSILVY